MADWDKWDGQSWYRNNKNRPSGVGTVSQSRRERVTAKAMARDQAALAAARAQAAQAAAAPAAETAAPCQKELGPSNTQLAAEKESSTCTAPPAPAAASAWGLLPNFSQKNPGLKKRKQIPCQKG